MYKRQAQEEEHQQYDAMKLRIKYMYESGDGQAAERVLTSGSISELLTQAEYAEKVHTYDRDQLEEYAATVQEVETLQDTLETEMANLESLEDDYPVSYTHLVRGENEIRICARLRRCEVRHGARYAVRCTDVMSII